MKRLFALLVVLSLTACAPSLRAYVSENEGNQYIELAYPADAPTQALGLDLVGDVEVIQSTAECSAAPGVAVTQCFYPLVIPGSQILVIARGVDNCRFWTVAGLVSFPCEIRTDQ